MSERIRPLGNYILVRPEKKEDTTKGGILLPDIAQTKPLRGEVIAVGPGKYSQNGTLVPMMVRVGEVICYSKYAGNEVKRAALDAGDGLLLMREDDVFGVVEGKP